MGFAQKYLQPLVPASSFKDTPGKRRLTDDGMQGANADFVVIGYDHGRRRI